MIGQHFFKDILIGLFVLPMQIEPAQNVRLQILIGQRVDLGLQFRLMGSCVVMALFSDVGWPALRA